MPHTVTIKPKQNMRTKILLASAAALALGLATSNAQVYSANVVGYVQLQLTNGFNMICNPLDLDGTGTNNTIQTTLGTQLPSGSAAYAFANGAFVSPSALFSHGAWGGGTNAVNTALNPGGGIFLSVAGGSPVTVTFIGNVLQGSLSNAYNAGFNIISSQVPIAGTMQHQLGYAPTAGDSVYVWNALAQAYNTPSSLYSHGAWNVEPNLSIGQAVFLKSAAAGGGAWTTNFTVQ